MLIPAREQQVVRALLAAIEREDAEALQKILLDTDDVDIEALVRLLSAVVFSGVFLEFDGRDPAPAEARALAQAVIRHFSTWLPGIARDPLQLTSIFDGISGRPVARELENAVLITWLGLAAGYLLNFGTEDWTVRLENILTAVANW